MDAAEVVETGRKLSETTLGEWDMILVGFLMGVPFMVFFACKWWACRKYRKYKARLEYYEKVLEAQGIGKRDDTDVSVFD